MSAMKKTMLAAFILTGIGVNIAQANSVTVDGAGVSATTDIVFGEITNISHTLTPVSGLAAGNVKIGLKVADGMIHAIDGKPHLFDVRFGPEAVEIGQSKNTNGPAAIFAGSNDPAHKIKLYLAAKGATWDFSNDSDNHGMTLTSRDTSRDNNKAATKTVGYQLYVDGDQLVAADTYTISTVAYTYTL